MKSDNLLQSLDHCQLSNVVNMLEQIVDHLSVFHDYAWMLKDNSDLEEAVILAFVHTIVFLSEATARLKQDTADDSGNQDRVDESLEQGRVDESLKQGKVDESLEQGKKHEPEQDKQGK